MMLFIIAAKAMPTTAHLQMFVRGAITSFKTPHYSRFPLIAAKRMPNAVAQLECLLRGGTLARAGTLSW